jgi:hypothetical protein
MSRDICGSSKAIFEDDTAHLLDLVGFSLPAFGLEVQDVFDPLPGEDMVTTTDTLIKAQTPEQVTEPVKGNIGVRSSA